MKWLVPLALITMIAGGCLVAYANTLPVYTSWKAEASLLMVSGVDFRSIVTYDYPS